VKVSPLVLPVSERPTPEIAVAWFCSTVAVAGAVITGSPLTVTSIEAGVAVPPPLSVARIVIVSDLVVASVSVRALRSVVISLSVPLQQKTNPAIFG
jgi:hypothetical protein